VSAGETNDSSHREIPRPDPELEALARALARSAPEPAVWRTVRAGTAGWTDPTLIRSRLFYPPGTSRAADRLAYYARHFRLVEVDATYYTLIEPRTAERWVQATPADFCFDVKAHPALTGHPIEVGRLPADLKRVTQQAGFERRTYADRLPRELVDEFDARFKDTLGPLREKNRLGCVVAQFPPWFRATRGNVRHLEHLAERLRGFPVAVEFRHPSWLSPERCERVFDVLERLRFSYVCVDEPDVPQAGVPPVVRVTNPALAVVRFHGHNIAGWRRKAASVQERFNYLYSPEQLRGWSAAVRRLSEEATAVHLVFNNCVRDYAVVNAQGLVALLAQLP
jgi:uncharacterized protein YecE (DUF72 family)